jgi:hypothetical protein
MPMRTIVALASVLALCTSNAWANSYKTSKHRRHAHVAGYEERVVPPVPYSGPTLVLHPAHNIACDTHYRSTRAIPCDQPVWVYGNVCEIDLGLGFYRPCE